LFSVADKEARGARPARQSMESTSIPTYIRNERSTQLIFIMDVWYSHANLANFQPGWNRETFTMPRRGRKPGPRGPYKSDVEDPDYLGGGGIRLRQFRLTRGWTLEVTAERTGLSPGTISNIENGGGYSPETLLKLAKAFRTTVGNLFDGDVGKGGDIFWPIWLEADTAARLRIIDYAKSVVKGKK
jgi:transcriptional regulator with XRE-family HTH domain